MTTAQQSSSDRLTRADRGIERASEEIDSAGLRPRQRGGHPRARVAVTAAALPSSANCDNPVLLYVDSRKASSPPR
jgi:hypothetical protein